MEQTTVSETTISVHGTAESAQQAAAAERQPTRERVIGIVVGMLAVIMAFIAFAGWSTATLVRHDSMQNAVLSVVCGIIAIEALIWIAGGVMVMLRAGRVARIVLSSPWAMLARVSGIIAACAWGIHIAA